MTSVCGKRVLITGAGHGLGLAMAREFSRAGALVIITDREASRVDEAVFRLRSHSLEAVGYAMDVTDAADVRTVRNRINDEHGLIDILVNNAGIVNGGAFLDVPLEKHLTTFDVNAIGPVIVTHLFLPDLIAQSESHIVNVASAAAYIPLPNGATYASSKWAVLGFSESLREELRQAGNAHVGITAICPSYINTGMFTGVKAPLLCGFLTPEWLAAKVVSCVRRNRTQFLAPWLVNFLPLIRVTWPQSAFRWLLRMMGATSSMNQWRGHSAKLHSSPAPIEVAHSESQP